MDILRSQSVRAQERYIQCIFRVVSLKALIIMTDPRSKAVNARKRKTQWDILRPQSVRVQERYVQCIFGVPSPKALITMNALVL